MNMSDPTFQTLTLIVPMLAIFYFLLWRPQQQRTKQLRQQVDNLRRGDTVVTAGIVGRVVKASNAEDPEILVEIADNVQVKVLKAALSDVRAQGPGRKRRTDVLQVSPWTRIVTLLIVLAGASDRAAQRACPTRSSTVFLPGCPTARVSLGLDLQGGSYLLLEVATRPGAEG